VGGDGGSWGGSRSGGWEWELGVEELGVGVGEGVVPKGHQNHQISS
jgi:hypothetical protein